MVKIILTPKRGNHARYFPHHGFLGLTPVIVSGTVSTRVEEDGVELQASQVVVRIRCYEGVGAHPGQGGGLGSGDPSSSTRKLPKINVLWETEKVLWTPSNIHTHPSEETFGPLGNTDSTWRLVIPTNAIQRSKGGQAVGSMTYRTWGAWWQVEAAILHKPSGIYGSSIVKTHPIFLSNYSRPLPPSRNQNVLQSNCARFTYSITGPALVACGDLARVSVSISPLGPPAEPFVLKKLSVGLQRTLAVEVDPDSASASSSSSPAPNALDTCTDPSSASEHLPSKRWKLRHLHPQPQPHPKPSSRPAFPPPSRHTSAVSSILAESNILLKPELLRSQSALDRPSLSPPSPHHVVLQIPKPKSRYHYSIGDSCQTKWAVVSYSLIIKAVIKSKSAGLETITLNALPVELMSVTNNELAAAIASLRPSNPVPPSLALPQHTFRRSAPPAPISSADHHPEEVPPGYSPPMISLSTPLPC
ncbi:hypothetical protein CROQUDRAFT_673412 [Cronartium quercuum f. sp. fusiforme G11]|uniref:Uncharacterized protein n=1 Tax=Cronartium quercuum f. sp. fusiforme G11 TaxID=708437 RepID=A0A9P6NFF9_9BASI|nr:hypothetical protein CROQUDRAFT_673412 [Cronartium quercuum f. sp. fusiforme G11]